MKVSDIPRKGLSVLLVDDERMVLEFFNELLEDLGFVVTTASNFFDAIFLLESKHFDILICDIGLGDQNGFDILALAEKKQIASLMITGFPTEEGRKHATESGAAYLPKPFCIDNVRATLAAMVPHHTRDMEPPLLKAAS